MRLSGRNLFLLAIVVVAALFGVVFLGSRQSPDEVAVEFMSALAKGDVDKLTALSSTRTANAEKLRAQWEFATHVAAPHYLFMWKVTHSTQANEQVASVALSVVRNAVNPGAYEENFDLPMVREGGKWKVNVTGISSEMYPGLPR